MQLKKTRHFMYFVLSTQHSLVCSCLSCLSALLHRTFLIGLATPLSSCPLDIQHCARRTSPSFLLSVFFFFPLSTAITPSSLLPFCLLRVFRHAASPAVSSKDPRTWGKERGRRGEAFVQGFRKETKQLRRTRNQDAGQSIFAGRHTPTAAYPKGLLSSYYGG